MTCITDLRFYGEHEQTAVNFSLFLSQIIRHPHEFNPQVKTTTNASYSSGKDNLTSSCKSVAAASQLSTIFQSSGHTLAHAPDPSLVLVQVSYWMNMHRRLRLHRHDSGA